MRRFYGTISHRIRGVALVFICLGVPVSVQASPTIATNPVVQLGSGTVTGVGTSHVTVNQATPLLGINWNSLGNNPGEVLRFNQPSASAIVLNRIVGTDPSQFLGSLIANGSVIVINPNGVFFGPQSQVNVNGLIASSLNITDTNFLNGRYSFDGVAANGSVRNEGQITAGPFGVYLLAPNVTNNGVIKSPDGHIALAAGTTAYLSDRADGRGFLVEVKAPTGEALNLKTLLADGGQVSMIGRLVTQSGLIQANTVRRQNGKIELVATDRVTLTSGSVTSAKGDAQGISDGGTVLAKADLTTGQTKFEQGAVLDVSGGVSGGNGGSAELSAASVTLGGQFLARAAQGYRGGRFLIDPTVGTQTVSTANLQSFSGSGASDVEFRSPTGTDLTVSANYNLAPVIAPGSGAVLSGWALPTGQEGFLRFTAGNNLIFSANSQIQNGATSGTSAGLSSAKWSYVGTAANDILFNSTKLFAGGGGNLTLNAGRDIKLVPDAGGGHTILQTFTGGNMSITAGGNLIAPSAFQGSTPGPSNQYSGIRLEGSGNLTITTGGDFLGGTVNGVRAGPGFVLSDGTAQVTVGGNFGAPDSYATLTIGNRITDSSTNTSRLGLATVNVITQNNIYLGLVQDRGLSDRIPGQTPTATVTANPNSSISLLSQQGNIHLQPPDSGIGGFGDVKRIVYPASFSAIAPNGNIFIERLLQFWPSPVGTLRFEAGQSILGDTTQADLAGISLCSVICGTVIAPNPYQPASVTLTAKTGDIRGLVLDFASPLTKTVTLSAGQDIREIIGTFPLPDLGVDATGKSIPAVTISAGRDIDLSVPGGRTNITASGLLFGGTGTARISAGRTLDLADSQGIVVRSNVNTPTTDANKGGLLDIAVGGDLKMSKSKISSENGASIFIHGLDVNRLNGKTVVLDGGTKVATTATLTTMTFQGQTVLAVGGQPVQRNDGSPIVVDLKNPDPFILDKIGKPIYLVDGRPALGVDQLPLLADPKDAIAGKEVLTVGGIPAFGISNKLLVVDRTAPASFTSGDLSYGTLVLDRAPVRLPDGTIVVVANGKVALAQAATNGSSSDGQPTMTNGTLGVLVGNRPASLVESLGGSMNVGTNQNSVNFQTGIVTLRGGSITAKAAGDINVALSRIATFGAGDVKGGSITLTSTTGDINAGFGSRNDVASFVIDQGVKRDAQGNPIIDPVTRQEVHELFFAQVPASGIFTFHAKDPFPLNFPVFNPVSPFETMVRAHELFGHDVSVLLPQIPAAQAAWKAQYEQTFLQFISDKLLGNVTLTAARDVVIPSGGLRGALIQVNAGRSFNVSGKVEGLLSAQTPFFFGNFANLVGLFNISGLSGSQSALTLQSVVSPSNQITISSNAVASASTASATTNVAQQESTESPAEATGRAKAGGGKGSEGAQKSASLRVKDKVRIKVETQREPVTQ
jgi:filamentous hemagglutinin family protein